MSKPTNIQILKLDGKAVFAVVPYDEWKSLVIDSRKWQLIMDDDDKLRLINHDRNN